MTKTHYYSHFCPVQNCRTGTQLLKGCYFFSPKLTDNGQTCKRSAERAESHNFQTMVAKRVLFPKTPEQTTVTKRLKQVESLARSNRPELKTKTFFANGAIPPTGLGLVELTAIAQGDTNSTRDGVKIKVKKIEIRGLIPTEADVFVTQSYGSYVPTIGSFTTPCIGCFVDDTENTTIFKEIRYIRNVNQAHALVPVWRTIKINSLVGYDGGTTSNCVRNRLHLVFVNATGAAVTPNCQVRIYYTDA